MEEKKISDLAYELLSEFLEGVKQELLDELDGKRRAGEFRDDKEFTQFGNRNATGKTRNSIKVNIGPMKGSVTAAEHVYYTFTGRAPGKRPPLSNIIDWCVAKGLPRAAAWPIAKKIAESGTALYRAGAREKNVLLDVTSRERIEAFKEKIKERFITQIRSEIIEDINTKF